MQTDSNKIYNFPNIISALALILSAISFIISYQASKEESLRVKREELRKSLSELIDTQKNFRENLHTRDAIAYYDLYSEKRFIYFAAAESIINEIPNDISWAEYNTLAKQALMDDNYDKSVTYLESAIKYAKTTQEKVYTRSAIAQFYFTDSPLKNYEKGRAYFKEAISILEGMRDPHFIMIIADTYRGWASYEHDAGFPEEARLLLARSEKYLNDLPNSFPLKKEQLKEIGDLMRGDADKIILDSSIKRKKS